MNIQLDLLARTSDPGTSHRAAASMRNGAAEQRVAILTRLAYCKERGATANEIDVVHGWRDGTAGRRLGELVTLGLVVRRSDTRLTSSGRAAHVHVLPLYSAHG